MQKELFTCLCQITFGFGYESALHDRRRSPPTSTTFCIWPISTLTVRNVYYFFYIRIQHKVRPSVLTHSLFHHRESRHIETTRRSIIKVEDNDGEYKVFLALTQKIGERSLASSSTHATQRRHNSTTCNSN